MHIDILNLEQLTAKSENLMLHHAKYSGFMYHTVFETHYASIVQQGIMLYTQFFFS